MQQKTILLANEAIPSPSVPWIIDHLRSSPTIAHLLSDILEGNAVAVSDGSYFEQAIFHCYRCMDYFFSKRM